MTSGHAGSFHILCTTSKYLRRSFQFNYTNISRSLRLSVAIVLTLSSLYIFLLHFAFLNQQKFTRVQLNLNLISLSADAEFHILHNPASHFCPTRTTTHCRLNLLAPSPCFVGSRVHVQLSKARSLKPPYCWNDIWNYVILSDLYVTWLDYS